MCAFAAHSPVVSHVRMHARTHIFISILSVTPYYRRRTKASQGYLPPDAQQRPKEYRKHDSGHSFSAGKATGLLAGAAAVGITYYEHEKHKKEKASSRDTRLNPRDVTIPASVLCSA